MTAAIQQSALSVIVPTYNRAPLVQECVRSLRNCGLAELEIIVVDDGSTDNTVEHFREPPPGVVYLQQPNRGVAAARNLGFAHSKGRYVAFLDSDDTWLPNVPGRAVALLDRHSSVDLLFCDGRMGNPEEGFRSLIERFGQQAFFDLPHTRPEPGLRVLDRQPFFQRMLQRNAIFLGAVLMRREAFARLGGFDPERSGTADWELCLRMTSQMTAAYWPEPLVIYSIHSQNMSGNRDRMLRDAYLSLASLVAKCPHVNSSEKRLIRRGYNNLLFDRAYLAYDRGDYGEARRRFAQLLRECPTHGMGFLYWLACTLPFGFIQRLRKLKWSFSGSVLSNGRTVCE